ncbi:MAG: glycosyltransferase family 4 protein [Myxococcota bacterium]
MKLLLVTQDFPPHVGGIQTWSHELARRFASSCRDFAVVAPDVPGSAEVDRELPFTVHRVRGTSNTVPLAAVPTLIAAGRKRRFDTVLHAQWQTMVASTTAAEFGGPQRIFAAAHGRELLFAPLSKLRAAQRKYDRLRERMLRRANRVFPVSHYTAGLVEQLGVSPERITVVGNGTDPQRFVPMDVSALRSERGLADRRVVMTVGRLDPRKGIDTVIMALPAVIERVPEAIYLIVGRGPDRARLEALVQEHGVADHVRFEEHVPEDQLVATFNLCDVFVTASRHEPPNVEGFGIVFLEANACGKPVIGARSGGIPDAVVEGETGLLVEPGSPEQLAEALCDLLGDPARCEALGAAGRARVEGSFTWDVAHARLLASMQQSG